MTVQNVTSPRLSLEEVSAFLQKNDLPAARYIKSISKSVESSVYSIITENENYILTLYEQNSLNPSMIKESSNYFIDKGFPFPKISGTGKLLDRQAILSSHLLGKAKNLWDGTDYETIGFLMGNLHKCSEKCTLAQNPTTPYIWSLSTNFYQIQYKIPIDFQRLEQEIFFLEENWPSQIPKGLIHGDIWRNNVLFSNDVLSGILDFKPSYEPFILDLANIIKGIPAENTTALTSLISSYELARPLTAAEYSSLHLMVSAKFLTTILYFLKKAIQAPNRKDEFQTYAFLNLLKLDSWKEQAELIT